MTKAERKLFSTETIQPSSTSLLDGLNIKTATTQPARKTKKDGSPTWDQSHAAFRYDLTDPDVYYGVSGIATSLGVNNISTVAEQMMDFALTMAERGRVWMQAHPNPDPHSTSMLLTWEDGPGFPKDVKPDRERKKRQQKMIAPARKRSSFAFRWSRQIHNRIKTLAAEYHCTLGAMVTRLLAHAIDEYRWGRLKLNIQYVASQNLSGWGVA